jgi:hypothetical protein
MSHESLNGKAETYRATAERMRRLAVRLRFSEARSELLDLADRFDRLAARAEGARDGGADQPVPNKRAGTEEAA